MSRYQIDVLVEDGLEAEVAMVGLDLALVEQAVAAVLALEDVAGPLEVSILLANDARLQALNCDFRGLDEPTDVLSFADDGDGAAFVAQPDAVRYLGDVALSYERVVAQAHEYGHSLDRELAYLTVHGMLHLLGYDHERGPDDAALMRAREEAALAQLVLPETP
ncbi:rRNA maturation RNase YbeY [Candidatus Chloroploca mongolica]